MITKKAGTYLPREKRKLPQPDGSNGAATPAGAAPTGPSVAPPVMAAVPPPMVAPVAPAGPIGDGKAEAGLVLFRLLFRFCLVLSLVLVGLVSDLAWVGFRLGLVWFGLVCVCLPGFFFVFLFRFISLCSFCGKASRCLRNCFRAKGSRVREASSTITTRVCSAFCLLCRYTWMC